MSKEKMVKLINDLYSAGYEIIKMDCYSAYNTAILLHPNKKIKKPFSKENIIKLIDIFFAVEYYTIEYELIKGISRKIKFIIHKLE